MVVYGPKTRQAALEMLTQFGKVFYSDENTFLVVESKEKLDSLIQRVLDRNDIAIVAREQHLMEYYTSEKKRIAHLRHQQAVKQLRTFIKTHPYQVAKVAEKDARIRGASLS